MGKYIDLTGMQFGLLTVLYRAEDYVQPSGQHKRIWHCRCKCGNECDIRASDLKSGNTKSCGCLQQSSRGKSTFEDLTGKEFGRLTVLFRLPDHITPSGQKQRMWRCKCTCGKECDVYGSQLKNGKKSCGCIVEEEKKRKETAKAIIENGEYSSSDKQTDTLIKKYLKSAEKATQRKSERRLAEKKERLLKKKIALESSSLAIKNPELLAEWNTTKNGLLTPYDVTPGSGKKVWWKCSLGHEWQATIASRVNGNGCPYCSNQRVLVGFNDLATTNPELLDDWDYERNRVLPTEISLGSSKAVWWKCKNGHSYEMKIYSRTGRQKSGCPYCSTPAKRVLKGFNDLQTKYPDLAKEWHPTRNGGLTPDSVLCGSAKRIWWIGKCGHEYEQSIINRVNGGNCPYCSHQRLLTEFNDFATEHPELLSEWDYEKNSAEPNSIMSHSHYKAWWKCPFGHSYQAWMDNRCGTTHSGCPICDKENHTSFPEQALFFYVKNEFPEAVNSDRNAIGMELDILIPTKRVAIEYDGRNWHKNTKHEVKKNLACIKEGIQLIRIREAGLILYEDCICFVREDVRSNSSLSAVIRHVLLELGCSSDVDVERDASLIYSSYITNRKTQSLQNYYPELAMEWHPSKNGNLSAEMVAPMTNKKVWWLGKCGHEWQMSVQDRTNQNCGCPICSGKRIVIGINDLLSEYPKLCEEWAYEKNNEIGLFPNKVAPHSDKKAWWRCKKCGNIWQSKIDARTRLQAGCPECGKHLISQSKYKPVKCIETGEVFISLQDAEIKTGINRTCISNCCRGKQKTAGKRHWKFS